MKVRAVSYYCVIRHAGTGLKITRRFLRRFHLNPSLVDREARDFVLARDQSCFSVTARDAGAALIGAALLVSGKI